MFEITAQQRKDLLEYLGRRPYIEVAHLIAMLASLKNKTEDKTDKATSKK